MRRKVAGDLAPISSLEAAHVRRAAEIALRKRLEDLTGEKLDRGGRLPTARHIVLGSVPKRARLAALEDVTSGDGSELRQPKDTTLHPRFHSARSSCALAVNAFGFWRCDPGRLVVDGAGSFEQLRFEAKFPIEHASRRVPPNLDVHVVGSAQSLAIESKLLEYLSPAKPASIAFAYDRAIETLAHPTWREQIERLRRNPTEFQFFAASQLIKHYLGLKSGRVEKTRLLYLFWEPFDAASHRVFTQHRLEITSFAERLADPDISFASMDYATLFVEWDGLGARVADHVRHLRDRYEVSVVNDS
jgi:hypothetical protein